MNSMASTTPLKDHYHVVSVTKIDPPEGMDGKTWHSYIIERGNSVVTGKKPGSLKTVAAHAKQVADDLNARTGVNSGSLYAARRKK